MRYHSEAIKVITQSLSAFILSYSNSVSVQYRYAHVLGMKLIVIFSLFFGTISGQSPQVRVEQGDLIGTTYTTTSGRTLFAFRGVPYAVPITHKNRFKEPQHLKPWVGVWNATTFSSICLQYSHPTYSIDGEEDCLYLNVYTPKLPEGGVSPLLDVLFYIHGGAFMFGNGNGVLPDYLLKNKDVVVVTVNYRLGILGFFSSGDSIVPGNNGLKDQVAALRWVHHNIIQFGGNPASVTIMGCSAGGASVHYHMLSSMSDGLFQKAVSMSGTALPPWTLVRHNTEKSIQLADYAGCATNSTRDTVKCLRKRPARQLVEMQKNFMTWRYAPFSPFGPTVEPPSVNTENFLTEEPIQLLKSGRVKDLPWLTTMAANEGLYPGADFIPHETLLKELNDKWDDIAPHLLMYNFSVSTAEEKSKVSAAIREYYLGAKPVSHDTIPEVVQLLGDRLFYNDITRAIKLHVASTKTTKAHCYKFGYRGKYSLTTKYAHNDVNYGAGHCDDIFYLLKCFSYDFDETVPDAATSDLMATIVSSFMRTGKPSVANVAWEPITSNLNENVRCLDIVSSHQASAMIEYDNRRILEFWKNLLPSEYSVEDVIVPAQKDEL